jgi:hypothetical protein
MGKAPFLVVASLLVALPWAASEAMPRVIRWAAPEKMTGMAQLVRVRRTAHRQRRARHARERAAEADESKSARSNKAKAGDTSEQRRSVSRQSPPVEPEAPSATQRQVQEKLAPPPFLSKLSAHPAVPSLSIKPPEIGKLGPETSPAKPQPTIWPDAEVIGELRRCSPHRALRRPRSNCEGNACRKFKAIQTPRLP